MSCFVRNLAVFVLLAISSLAAQQDDRTTGSSASNNSSAQTGIGQDSSQGMQESSASTSTSSSSGHDSSGASAPSTTTHAAEGEGERQAVTIKSALFSLPKDQLTIWTSPAHIHRNDLYWLLPMGAATAVLLGSDSHSMARERSNAQAIHRSSQMSNYGLATVVAIPAFTYAIGEFNGSSKARETGLLTGEALVDSLVVNQALKLALQRQRPTPSGGSLNFFSGTTNASFPSSHAMLAWTAASVFAHEYPGLLPQALAYGLASAVSVSRVTARAHFPSDVVVGSAMGWLIGRQIYRAHTQNDDSANYGTFENDRESDREYQSSPYVALDSWIYPSLKRLAGLGYIHTQFTGQEPWTQQECLRQTEEAEYLAQDLAPESEVRQLITALKTELTVGAQYYRSAQIESVYTRYMNISGQPLRDSYHFGATIYNDFGRPYDQGNNPVTGATASAVAGPVFFYVRGEYEHAPGRAAEPHAVQAFADAIDLNPVSPPAPIKTIDRFYPLDMYAGVQVGGYALSGGKESLWLGPTQSGPLMISDNADPMYMLRLAHTSPFYLPWIFRHLGPISDEYFFSKLSGHHYPARPFFNLQKISLHPTENLEIGFTRASEWAGAGHPFTLHALEKTLFALGDSAPNFGNKNDPGDRKSGFDFSYRLPGMRKWLTLYSDAYSDDDPNPLANPRRAAWNPGLYLSHVPGVSKLDLRVEAVSTQPMTSKDHGSVFIYGNADYHGPNLNKGVLFGNSTGRDGRAYQAWTTYHFAAAKTLELSYRQLKLTDSVWPGGGTQTDGSARLAWRIGSQWSVDAFAQYERWLIPVLQPKEQRNFAASIQVTFHPHWLTHD